MSTEVAFGLTGGPAVAPRADDMIVTQGLSLVFDAGDEQVQALDDINLTIRRGEFVSLIGPSGCGKTTLLRIIADLAHQTGGSITVHGGTPREARQRRLYGIVFQTPALLPWRRAAANVALPSEIMGEATADRRRIASEALERVDLKGFESKYPWQLSGGMQQRVAIARAMSFGAELLLMDEPFGALDEITRDALNLYLRTIWEQARKTVVFVTHSIAEAVFLSDRIVVMSPRPGRIVEVIDCNLPLERKLEIRESAAFLEHARQVRSALGRFHSYD